jgi:exonuclease III
MTIIGDMNVAASYRDGSHWEKRGSKKQNETGSTGERIVEAENSDDDCGERFAACLEEGDFCDVWRKLHPQGVVVSDKNNNDDDDASSFWERPNYTWRGALTKNLGGYAAKYQGKGQRIDYFLLSSKLGVKEIETCEIRGYGTNKGGFFCGSDHCAIELRFKRSN